jgi:hypothetical protein
LVPGTCQARAWHCRDVDHHEDAITPAAAANAQTRGSINASGADFTLKNPPTAKRSGHRSANRAKPCHLAPASRLDAANRTSGTAQMTTSCTKTCGFEASITATTNA